ncbi:hypothetical protein [Streptomyces sp. NPDC093089]|uniref:hypothetical protein n=1 Tax=Streptomyces sp. NPDC093089 TaxID=3366024 RepID=UPI0037F5B84D
MAYRVRRRVLVGLVGTVASIIGVATLAVATPATMSAPATTSTEETPPLAVEEFAYPEAARILAQEGISLKKGDGHIVLAACNYTADQIKIHTVADPNVNRKADYCFEVNAASGYVTMDLPRVIALESTGPSFSADLTAGEQKTTVEVPKEGFLSVGEGDISSGTAGARSVVVEIRVTG